MKNNTHDNNWVKDLYQLLHPETVKKIIQDDSCITSAGIKIAHTEVSKITKQQINKTKK